MNGNTIVVLVNPLYKKRAKQTVVEIADVLSENNISFQLFTDTWPADLNSYKEVWMIGGDGTLNHLLNRYSDITIPISVFKAGTGNDFALGLYGAVPVTQQARYLLSAPTHWIDAGMCNEHIFMNGVGIGFDGEVVRSIRSIRWIGGHFGYMLAVLKQVFFYKEIKLRIEYEDKSVEDKFLLCLVCNSVSMGGGFRVSPESKITDGLLNIVLCTRLGLLKRLRYLPVIEKGRHLKLQFIDHFKTSKLKITSSKNIYIQLDGELLSGKVFDITVMHKRYLFKY